MKAIVKSTGEVVKVNMCGIIGGGIPVYQEIGNKKSARIWNESDLNFDRKIERPNMIFVVSDKTKFKESYE